MTSLNIGDYILKIFYSSSRKGLYSIVVNYLKRYHQGLIVDLGGGVGHLFSFLKKDYNKIVLDKSLILLKKGLSLYPEINFIMSVSEKIPMRENSITCIVMNDALHHFQNHENVLSETYKVLRKEGCLLINDFDYDHFLSKIMYLFEYLMLLGPNYISLENLKNKMKLTGFKILDVYKKSFEFFIVAKK